MSPPLSPRPRPTNRLQLHKWLSRPRKPKAHWPGRGMSGPSPHLSHSASKAPPMAKAAEEPPRRRGRPKADNTALITDTLVHWLRIGGPGERGLARAVRDIADPDRVKREKGSTQSLRAR